MRKYLIFENCENFLKSSNGKKFVVIECLMALRCADTVYYPTHIFVTRESCTFADDSFSKKNGEEWEIHKGVLQWCFSDKSANLYDLRVAFDFYNYSGRLPNKNTKELEKFRYAWQIAMDMKYYDFSLGTGSKDSIIMI